MQQNNPKHTVVGAKKELIPCHEWETRRKILRLTLKLTGYYFPGTINQQVDFLGGIGPG